MPATPRRRFAVAAALTVALATALPPHAYAATNPYERGPAPTVAALQAAAGPFRIADTTVDATEVSGFGGATIYYPTDTSQGRFGGIAIAPGYLAPRSTLAWLAARVASHGFVVINIDTLERQDGPSIRARQLIAALDYLTTGSAAASRVDPARLGVMGHSMGGGATIEAADQRPSLRAAVPLTPWDAVKNWPQLRVPTMIVGAQNDERAPPADHAERFYASMSSAPEKAYLELAGAEHRAPITPNITIGMYSVAWLKRFMDNDVRYDQFLCPPPAVGTEISQYEDTCPHA